MSRTGKWGRRLGRPSPFDKKPRTGTHIAQLTNTKGEALTSPVHFTFAACDDKGARITFGQVNAKGGVDRTVDVLTMDWPALNSLQYDLRRLIAARRERLANPPTPTKVPGKTKALKQTEGPEPTWMAQRLEVLSQLKQAGLSDGAGMWNRVDRGRYVRFVFVAGVIRVTIEVLESLGTWKHQVEILHDVPRVLVDWSITGGGAVTMAQARKIATEAARGQVQFLDAEIARPLNKTIPLIK
jgi:hypothetical protein